MTTAICPTVWEADLPPIAYDHLYDPEEAHRVIGQARRQGPLALGPHGPEVLSYELVRAVLRDTRFAPAVKLVMTAQGITSGPVWDRAAQSILSLEGDTHHRLRRLVSKAFTPRGAERIRTSSSTSSLNSSIRSPPPGTATWSPISHANFRPLSSARCSVYRVRTGSCSPPGPMTSRKYSNGTSPTTNPPSQRRGPSSTAISKRCSRSAGTTSPRT